MKQRAGDTRTPAEYDAHLARIRAIITAWHQGEIGVTAKRERIAQENASYYAEATRGDTGADLTVTPKVVDELLHGLALRLMVPVEAAGAALAATREAAWRAAHTDDPEEAARIQEDAQQAYLEILRTAR
jgi:hypothetical protein